MPLIRFLRCVMKIGIDVTKPSRFVGKEDRFSRYILTPDERARYEESSSRGSMAVYLAERWAAKEAIYKATGDKSYLKYSILDNVDGFTVKYRPDISLSVSAGGEYVVAIAIVNTPFKEKNIMNELEIKTRIKELLCDALGIDANVLEFDTPLFGDGIGLDSIDSLEIVSAIDSEWGVSMTGVGNENFHDINALAAYVAAHLN